MGTLRRDWVQLALLAVLAVGAALRLYNVNWDDGHHIHPDERFIVMVEDTLSWPKGIRDLLNPRRSTLNPFYLPPSEERPEGRSRHFAYGHFPLYLLHFLSEGLARLARLFLNPSHPRPALDILARISDYQYVNLLGRVLSALFDTGTILFVYLLGKRLYGQKAGLLAATFLTFTVMHIQLSHFYAVDVVMAFFAVAAVYFDVCVAQGGGQWSSIWAGVCTGLAVASKFSAAPLFLPLTVAHLVAVRSRWRAAIRPLLLSLLTAFLVYAITSPYVLLDFRSFISSIGWESKMVRGVVDLPYTRQYRRTAPYLYHIEQQLRWGMGWPLGLAGFAGFAWAILRLARRRVSGSELTVLAWTLPYFLITGSFMVKYMRYMVLMTPFLCIFGAGMLFALRRRLANLKLATCNLQPIAWRLLIGIVLAGTILWAMAFMEIYREPLTRVRASEWIYRHIPQGTTITNEDWDDRLPFSRVVDGRVRTPGEYNIVKMALQEPDDEAKFRLIVDALTRADYVIVSSKRFYGWLPRLRDRFPITNRYYELLFAEKLGFELAATFTNYPRLDGLEFVDDRADESFTVYDHPKVLIYRKVRQLSEEEFRALFAESLRQASAEAPPSGGKTLLLSEPVDELPVVDDYRWNGLANRHHLLAVAFWWLVLEVVGLAAWPLTFALFRHLSDRGYILAKSLGLLTVAYPVWLLASLRLLTNSLPTIVLALCLLSLLSLYFLRRHRKAIVAFWRGQKGLILFNEALFASAYLLFVGVRILNPDLWQPWFGGEKPMEFAFLNACLKSPYFPPYDPYFAGGYINYYYYGQFLVAVLIKLTGIVPSVAFNLAIPMLFALTVGSAFCVGYNLGKGSEGAEGTEGDPSAPLAPSSSLRPLLSGLLAALFVAVLGNLDGMFHLLDRLGQLGGLSFESGIPGLGVLVRAVPGVLALLRGRPLPPLDYFGRTRVIPGTINEFPFFSFLFADLHPHMIAMPFTILLIAFALNLMLGKKGKKETRKMREKPFSSFPLFPSFSHHLYFLSIAIIALVLGALAVINTWDLPTYFLVMACAFFLREYIRAKGFQRHFLSSLISPLSTLFLGLALYWPFFAHYKALHVGLGLAITRGRTELGPFLAVWGFFLFVAVAFVLTELAGRREELGALRFVRLALRRWEELPHLAELYKALVRQQTPGYRLALYGLGGVLLVAAGLALCKFWVLALLLPLIAGAVLLLARRNASPGELFTCLLILAGLLVMAGCEIFYLKDHLAGDRVWWRMNTVFKFYIQAWVMLGLGTGAALPRLWTRVGSWRSAAWRRAWKGAFALLLLSSLVYPIVYTPVRVRDRFPGARPPIGTLDGMAFMSVGSYTWPEDNLIELKYDYQAIRWLLANVRGTPVVAEAALPYYREGGLRVATYTGLPTLLGAHQSEQRYAWQVGQRDGQVREFFNTTDIARALQLVRELRISYIYIGQLERAVYDPAGLAKFDRMAAEGSLEVVFENERVRIYRVRGLTMD